MSPERRGVLFDLDDTLYPLRRFVLSGFGAVATHLAGELGVEPRQFLGTLVRARRRQPGRELQALLDKLGLSHAHVLPLVEIIRRHVPRLRLPRASTAALRSLRGQWRLGIVTNGDPDMQARKVRALGLDTLVDTVVYADAEGSRQGKPDPVPFELALAHLGVRPDRAVFVGNDERTDVEGAARVRMRTIRAMWYDARVEEASAADLVVRSLADVPTAVAHLVEGPRS